MVGKPNLRSGANGHAVEPADAGDELDRRRAASMADEGGTSGAHVEVVEFGQPPSPFGAVLAPRHAGAWRTVALGLAALACGLLTLTLFARRRR